MMGAASLPTQARTGAVSPSRETGAAARLALAESLLVTDDATECAQAAVDWLGLRGGARRAVCALFDEESGKIARAIGYGVPRAQLERLSIALEEPDHPLVLALASREPVLLAKNGHRGKQADLWRGDFLAIPLSLSENREARLGLLLVSPSRCGPEARWAADLLGQKLARVRTAVALAEGEHKL